MSRKLTKLLGDSVQTRVAVSELRRMAGDDSDVRLITEILARAHSIIRALGLDPADTTGREVYQALMAAAPRLNQTAWAKASDWVMMDFDGQIISFHPVDIVENYHHQLPYGQHCIESGKRGLGYEITRRFSAHPRTHTPTVERVVCEGGICYIASAVGEPVKSASPFQLPVANTKPKSRKLASVPVKPQKSGSKKSHKKTRQNSNTSKKLRKA